MNALLDRGDAIHSTSYRDQYDANVPLLITFGTGDQLTSFDAGYAFFDKVKCEDKTWKRYEGWFHELHNEPEKQKVMDFYKEWVLERVKKRKV